MTDNKENVLEEYLEKAKNGDVDAQFYLAECYRKGIFGECNLEKAYQWYLEAAKQGHAEAMLWLGNAYFYGRGVEKDREEGKKWWEEATNKGNNVAPYNFAMSFVNGRKRDDKKTAIEWFLKARRLGNVNATFRIGKIINESRNYIEANKWFAEAAKKEQSEAQYYLAKNLEGGNGIDEPDLENALKWYSKSAENGYYYAITYLESLYKEDAYVEFSYKTANEWLETGAQKGDVQAQYKLAYNLEHGIGVDEVDVENAFKWYLEAAERGDRVAIRKIANAYNEGWGVTQNFEKANEWFEKDGGTNDGASKFAYAENLRLGRGVNEPDLRAAFSWNQKAINEKNEDALQMMSWYLNEAEKGNEILQLDVALYYLKNSKSGHIEKEKALNYLKQLSDKGNEIAREIYDKEIESFHIETELNDLRRRIYPENLFSSYFKKEKTSLEKFCEILYRQSASDARMIIQRSFLDSHDKKYEGIQNVYHKLSNIVMSIKWDGYTNNTSLLSSRYMELEKYVYLLLEEMIDVLWKDFSEENCGMITMSEYQRLPMEKLEILSYCYYPTDEKKRLYSNMIMARNLVGQGMFEDIMNVITELMITFYYNPGVGNALNPDVYFVKSDFINKKIREIAYAIAEQNVDLVAVYERQILSHMISIYSEKVPKRWKEDNMDLHEKIEWLFANGYMTVKMKKRCDSVRYYANKGHHIASLKEWNEFDTINSYRAVIELIKVYADEVEGVPIKVSEKEEERTKYLLDFYEEEHKPIIMSDEKLFKEFTFEQLGYAVAEGDSIVTALYSRRILEMWIDKKNSNLEEQYGIDNILEKIDLLYAQKIINEAEKRIAHELRIACNAAMHIAKEEDFVYSVDYIYEKVKYLYGSDCMEDAYFERKEFLNMREQYLKNLGLLKQENIPSEKKGAQNISLKNTNKNVVSSEVKVKEEKQSWIRGVLKRIVKSIK